MKPAPLSSRRQRKPRGYKRSEFSRDTGIPADTLDRWEHEGMPVRTKPEAMRWIAAHKQAYLKVEGSQDQEQWSKADWDKFKTRWQALRAQHEYEVARGDVHSKTACAASLIKLLSEHLQPLLSIGSRLTAQFPEMGQKLKDAADREVDAAMLAVKEGLK